MIILMALAIFAFAQNQEEANVDVQIDEKDGKKVITVTVEADSTNGDDNGKLEIVKKVIVIGDDEVVFPENADVQHILDSLGIDLNIDFENLENLDLEAIEKRCDDAEKQVQTILMKTVGGLESNCNTTYETKTPIMGVNLSDLTFQEAYEKHYPYNFGVELTSVIKGSNADRAGLMAGDIVTRFDGDVVRGVTHMQALIRSKNIGDTVKITYFRNEGEFNVNLTFAPKHKKNKEDEYNEGIGENHKAGKLSPGYGGGGPYAKYVNFDYSGINAFISQFGFTEISPERTIYFGGGGMGNVGKGWFLGGKGFGFSHTEDISIDEGGKRHLILENGFGGVTLTKKIPLFTERLVLDFDLMLGGGTMSMEIGESDGFSWESGTINGKHQKFHKNYFASEASIGLMWRVKSWFGFHGQFGKMETFTLNDNWTENTFPTDSYTVEGDAPDIPSGLTYTVGVWFGF